MKKLQLVSTLLLASSASIPTWANIIENDTTRVIDIEEVVVVASPKVNYKFRQQPSAVSLFSQKELQQNHITSLKNLTAVTPNFFMPDYGSRLTSAIYIRGIGSRINTPAVGLYVDNIPYLDKSSFDFNFSDIERIDVLRGPQGTLYGRNTMGGLVMAYTKNPFRYEGTDIRLNGSTGNNSYGASLSHYHRISDKFAFSASGFYQGARGFFKNETLNNWADPEQSAGGRLRAIWLPAPALRFDFNTSYEYSDEGGYTYGLVDKNNGSVGPILGNEKSKYRRGMLNSGLNIQYYTDKFIFNSTTGYQHLDDRMFMDQDFTAADAYTLEQKQRLNSWNQEFVIKSNPEYDLTWNRSTGVNLYYNNLHTNANVGFGPIFIQNIQSTMDAAMQHSPVKVTLDTQPISSPGAFSTPSWGTALFHQSDLNDLFGLQGLTLTLGVRFDYEKMKIDYDSEASIGYSIQLPGGRPATTGDYFARYYGNSNRDFFHILPKFALSYKLDRNNNIYIQTSRGMRSGGYNVQMISDYLANAMQRNLGDIENNPDVNQALEFKPEYSWNFEVGSHLNLFDRRLQADFSAFYIETRDQQVSRFVASGLGRYTANAGKSHSYGIEASLIGQLTDKLSFNAAYGYTRATFTDYDGQSNGTQYTGNYVPFVPRNTINLGAAYTINFNQQSAVQSITLNANYRGTGKTFWTESNNASQSYYGTYNSRISAQCKLFQLDIWVENIFNKKYNTFYFESMRNGFAQISKPRRFGIDLRMHL